MAKVLHIVNDLIRGGTEGQCARVAMGLAARGKGGMFHAENAEVAENGCKGEDISRQRGGIGCGIRGDLHRVAVFRREGFFLERVEAVCGPVYEIKVRHLVRFGTIKAIFDLRTWILNEKFDVVHTWDAESSVFGGLAAVWAGVPLITSRRDLGEIYSGWKTCMLRWMDRRAVKVVVNAKAIGEHFVAQGLDEARVRFIPNVIDLGEFDELAGANGQWSVVSSQLSSGSAGELLHAEGAERGEKCPQIAQIGADFVNREPGVVNLVCVSRMDPEKDHACLLRAFKKLGEQDSGCRMQNSEGDREQISGLRSPVLGPKLFLVGDGVERKRLENLSKELGIEKNVVFMGDRSDVPSVLAQMDVGVLIPKGNEGLSNSILEYMAAGLPVVCSDCGGNAELVENGKNGFVVPISDENRVFLALNELKNAEKRQEMGGNGRKRVENEFSMKFVFGEFETLYGRFSASFVD